MLILRGLIVALGGFLFIFLPGTMISILTRRGLRFDTNLLLWGMGVMVVTLFPALFLTSLLRLLILGDRVAGTAVVIVFSLLGSAITAVFLLGGMYLLLRWRRIPPEDLQGSGIMLGFGVGLLTDVFQGISLVGAGLRMLFGDTAMPELAQIAAQPWVDLLISLVALNVYRIALVAISAALGGLVARALVTARQRWLWLAVLINAAAAWSYTVIGLALGNDNLAANVVVILLETVLAVFAICWLIQHVPAVSRQPGTKKARKEIRKR